MIPNRTAALVRRRKAGNSARCDYLHSASCSWVRERCQDIAPDLFLKTVGTSIQPSERLRLVTTKPV